MPERSLTALLKTYHDKLDEHTVQLHDTMTKIKSLEASVSRLEDEVAEDDDKSGLRAGLREWIANIRELL